MKQNKLAIFVAAATLAGQALAVNGAQYYTPVVNEAGILTLHSSSYGEASKLGVGLNYNMAIDPAETSESRGKLKNYVHSVNLGVGSKLSDKIHAFVDLSGHMLSPADSTLTGQKSRFTLGNIKVGAGYAIIDNDEGGLGVGVTPFIVAPVGTKNLYFDGPRNDDDKRSWEYGAVLAIDYRMGHSDYALLNLGWDRRHLEDYLSWGFGYQKAVFGDHAILFEVRGEQNLDDPKVEQKDPVEADIAFRGYMKERSLSWTIGAGRGFNNDFGSPDLRVMAGVNWQLDHHHDHGHHEEAAAPVAEPVKEEVAAPVPTPAPVAKAAPVTEEKHVIEHKSLKVSKIYFANNKEVILEKSFPALDKLAADLNANPGIKKLQVEGHTDNVGNADYNKALSKKRADSVKAYLIGKGVDEKRLTTEGVGSDNPIDSNDKASGRANNRRVEFKLIEVDGSVKVDLAE